MHRGKILPLFLKLDIHRAFDTIDWAYLLDSKHLDINIIGLIDTVIRPDVGMETVMWTSGLYRTDAQ